jgi:hypothetical protein
MKYENKLKGNVTQTLVSTILRDGGYLVSPLGIEEVVHDLNRKDPEIQNRLNLPEQLRTLPDFLVTLPDYGAAWLLEVKYRKEWTAAAINELEKKLIKQARHWGDVYVLILLGKPIVENSTRVADSCKIFRVRLNNEKLEFFIPEKLQSTDHFSEWPASKQWFEWRGLKNNVVWGWNRQRHVQAVFENLRKTEDQESIAKAVSVIKSLSNLGGKRAA